MPTWDCWAVKDSSDPPGDAHKEMIHPIIEIIFKPKRNSPCRAICNKTTRQHCAYGAFSFLLFRKKPNFLCAGPSRWVSKRGEWGFPVQDTKWGFSWNHWRNSPPHPPHPLLPFPAFSSPSLLFFGHSPRCTMCAAPGSCYFQQWRRTTHHPG